MNLKTFLEPTEEAKDALSTIDECYQQRVKEELEIQDDKLVEFHEFVNNYKLIDTSEREWERKKGI